MARTSQIRAAQAAEAAAATVPPNLQPKLPDADKLRRYPGWHLDLRWHEDLEDADRDVLYPMGIHHTSTGAQSDMLLVREVAMMLVMDRLTDKPDWHVKVFDEEIAEKWRQEALAWPDDDLWNRVVHDTRSWLPEPLKNILSKQCVDYCILELRQKAEHFARTGITPTLDATFSVAKSDVLVPPELHMELREAFARLQADQASHPDWHPDTNGTVQDLVHPSMYPLVFGRSRFLPEEVVGVDDAVDKWAGKGEVIPRRPEWGEEATEADRQRRRGAYDQSDQFALDSNSSIHKSYWSTVYQWLPSNVEFTADGGVRFTSYINNLHPTKHRDVYTTLEKLIEKALPMWDQCLALYKNQGWAKKCLFGAGRHEPRIVPENPDDDNENNWDPGSIKIMLAREAAANNENQETGTQSKQDGENDRDSDYDSDEDEDYEVEDIDRWEEIRVPIQLEPPPFSPTVTNYAVDPSLTLRTMFKNTGLQIIVKMASIELTPDKPEFAPGSWHVEGQLNEHIVATALYYLDSANITDTSLDFRTLTHSDAEQIFPVGQGNFHWLERNMAAKLRDGSPCMQNYGSVRTPERRLLAFPNVFQHRVSGFRLADPTKPGHRRFVALWLVDPLTRIISTANVPPQQAGWWAERALRGVAEGQDGKKKLPAEIAQLLLERGGMGAEQLAEGTAAAANLGKSTLPPELLNMVRTELGSEALPMTREEAEEHRLKLMQTRSRFQAEAREKWASIEYNFCEH